MKVTATQIAYDQQIGANLALWRPIPDGMSLAATMSALLECVAAANSLLLTVCEAEERGERVEKWIRRKNAWEVHVTGGDHA